jgi:hypothetical protein
LQPELLRLSQFPPFDSDQSLTNEETVDILEFDVPNSWQKSMVLQSFDPLIHTVTEFISFCERHEFTEGTLDNSKEKGVKPKTNLKSGSNDAKWRAKSSLRQKLNVKQQRSSVIDINNLAILHQNVKWYRVKYSVLVPHGKAYIPLKKEKNFYKF